MKASSYGRVEIVFDDQNFTGDASKLLKNKLFLSLMKNEISVVNEFEAIWKNIANVLTNDSCNATIAPKKTMSYLNSIYGIDGKQLNELVERLLEDFSSKKKTNIVCLEEEALKNIILEENCVNGTSFLKVSSYKGKIAPYEIYLYTLCLVAMTIYFSSNRFFEKIHDKKMKILQKIWMYKQVLKGAEHLATMFKRRNLDIDMTNILSYLNIDI